MDSKGLKFEALNLEHAKVVVYAENTCSPIYFLDAFMPIIKNYDTLYLIRCDAMSTSCDVTSYALLPFYIILYHLIFPILLHRILHDLLIVSLNIDYPLF